MKHLFPVPPAVATPLAAKHDHQTLRDFLALRRSASKACLSEPGPTSQELDDLVTVATRVPDHRRVGPWRFLVFEGDQRAAFGEAAAKVQAVEDKDVTPFMQDTTRQLLLRAPTVVAVISSPDPTHRTPVWEQELSVGAASYNLLLAANSAGWGACWLTEWISFSAGINALLGLTEHERVAGFVYIGTSTADPQERMRPNAAERITRWSA